MSEFSYPSIAGPTFAFLDAPCIAFEKYDGSNLRFFWDQKRGWHSTGTRYRWFKPATPTFGPAVEMFHHRYANGITETLRRYKEYRGITELVAFCEFFGPQTFSGLHDESDEKQLVLFDIYVPSRGFVSPTDFIAHFGNLPIAKTVYQGPLSRLFIEDVQKGTYPVVEGVVAKGVHPRRRNKGKGAQEVWMAKVKTQKWLDELAKRSNDSDDLKREYEQNVREQQSMIETSVPGEPVDDN
jgi:hypothetical protein